jgi:hypothetical protein
MEPLEIDIPEHRKKKLEARKRNIERKKHLGLREKETMDLLTKKPWSH